MEEQTAGSMPNALNNNGYRKLMQESCFEVVIADHKQKIACVTGVEPRAVHVLT